MLNLKVFKWHPTRSKAAMRAGLVKMLGRNVIEISSKSKDAARMLKSWQAKRREARSSFGIEERNASRVLSVHQNRRKADSGDIGIKHAAQCGYRLERLVRHFNHDIQGGNAYSDVQKFSPETRVFSEDVSIFLSALDQLKDIDCYCDYSE